MELGNNLILIGAGLVTLSIFAGLVSSRIGAPLLLVFLALGMLAGEDALEASTSMATASLTWSVALPSLLSCSTAGLRTSRARLALALWPALVLATVGVAVTAVLTGMAAG